MPEYKQPELEPGEPRSTRRLTRTLRTAPPRPRHADRYVRITVFLATVLFLVGISGHFPMPRRPLRPHRDRSSDPARLGRAARHLALAAGLTPCFRVHRVIGSKEQGVFVVVGLGHRDPDADAERHRNALRRSQRLDRTPNALGDLRRLAGPSCSPQSTTNSSPPTRAMRSPLRTTAASARATETRVRSPAAVSEVVVHALEAIEITEEKRGLPGRRSRQASARRIADASWVRFARPVRGSWCARPQGAPPHVDGRRSGTRGHRRCARETRCRRPHASGSAGSANRMLARRW